MTLRPNSFLPEVRAAPSLAPAPRPRVAVCIATMHRPPMLRALLDSLGMLAFPPGLAPEIRLFVVDNDADGSARSTVERATNRLRWPVMYMLEPERNIARARNRGVAAALAWEADFVAFVDDDECVPTSWIATLMAVQDSYDADIVRGPVVTRLPDGTPEWLREGGGFDRTRRRTGEQLRYASTGNVLVRARLLASEPPGPFDPSFGLSGGSDSLFFTRSQRAGATIVWADEAAVEEYATAHRARTGWVVRRAFREGNTALFCERAQPANTRRTGLQVIRGCARLTFGLCSAVVAPVRGRAGMLKALRHLAYGAGTLTALAGHRYFEYATVAVPLTGSPPPAGLLETDRSAGNGAQHSRSSPTFASPPPSSET
jgi:succinoglycan biosynthesis protein ExoM